MTKENTLVYLCENFTNMLIRFAIKNLFSFKEETEFNLLPSKTKRLSQHKHTKSGIEILKLSAIYGANGSGKSNLIRSISLLKMMILRGLIPTMPFMLLPMPADRPRASRPGARAQRDRRRLRHTHP